MNLEKYLFAGGAWLLVWPMRGEAHSSFEAMQHGGNLPQITAELIHPLFEQPLVPAAIITILWVFYVARRALKGWLNAIVITKD